VQFLRIGAVKWECVPAHESVVFTVFFGESALMIEQSDLRA